MDRSDQIQLASDVCRCIAMAGCQDQLQCARRMASVPQGAPMGDYSFNRVPGDPCQWFWPITTRRQPAESVVRPVKRWPGREA
jgi:hypothetical protein